MTPNTDPESAAGAGEPSPSHESTTVAPASGDASEAASSSAFAADLLRGHTDTIVLGVLRAGDSYGYEIHKAIRDATGGDYEIKEATLYASFRRLTKDGLIEPYWGDETQGGRRKYYRITDAGRAVYRRNVDDWIATQAIINTLLNLKGDRS
ncbi:PadR family transcriptional regulator [Humibacter sp.]|jgi:DNA-binding PadR family transcriptional regulator|uniref:PadR family transcriptional regulator n=1 Tax=Humibacter sp. TaxID=1940291 RepID=UPI002C1D2534|nr:PadR family transcriptional regulator [Humibacter sp.]HVX07304.1 PadR family transcriptional regulator [Humibacter sp.]